MKQFAPKELSRRTPGEELWLARKAAGKTAVEAAVLAGLPRHAYSDAERDRNGAPTPLKSGLRKVSRPSLPLLLALARRRSGLGLAGVVRAYGVSKVTVLARERAGSPSLLAFWTKRGFRFPEI